jgi:hypothetical protein
VIANLPPPKSEKKVAPTKKPRAPTDPEKKPVGRPRLDLTKLTPEEVQARKDKRYTPKENK